MINSVCSTLIELGLGTAKAGEFTRRAWQNGKLNITQVEALSDLINAETPSQLRLAHNQKQAGKYLQPLRERIIQLLVQIEATIDFAEDINSESDLSLKTRFEADLTDMASQLRYVLRSAHRGSLIRSGIKIALIGKTNVGKSSLMNKLAERDISIVSAIPGTTRDSLETRLNIGSYLVNVFDTAGIRQTDDHVELEGIKRAILRTTEANIVVFILDSILIREHGATHEFMSLADAIKSVDPEFLSNTNIIICINKSDLISSDFQRQSEQRFFEEMKNYSLGILTLIWTTCLEEEGHFPLIKELNRQLDVFFTEEHSVSEFASDFWLSRERHIECLKKSLFFTNEALESIALNDPAITAYHVRCCLDSIGEITGMVVNDQILGSIFSQFCIGK